MANTCFTIAASTISTFAAGWLRDQSLKISRSTAVRTQHALEEATGGGSIAPLFYQDVKVGAMLDYRTPQQLQFASQRDEHLVEVRREG